MAQGAKTEIDSLLASGSRVLESEGLDPTPLRRAAGKAPAGAQVGDLIVPASAVAEIADAACDSALRRASIVVMPLAGVAGAETEIANGLTHDIIFGLAKLRSLRVIARGTAFALRDRALSPGEA